MSARRTSRSSEPEGVFNKTRTDKQSITSMAPTMSLASVSSQAAKSMWLINSQRLKNLSFDRPQTRTQTRFIAIDKSIISWSSGSRTGRTVSK
ncbi:hypothetical protein ARMSODRAFT_964650 [Armillaria solidipes]|uniref:Uncharacterized protein n=1 Tax=Armillaria solidipes TaxID=1076256 RepID=A0A2H3AY80_9AGAR|nr:hypothetical protein ARMSODRAFT_964650 [Armillaria solidipes]